MNYWSSLIIFIAPSIFFGIHNLGIGDDSALLIPLGISAFLFLSLSFPLLLFWFFTKRNRNIGRGALFTLSALSIFWFFQFFFRSLGINLNQVAITTISIPIALTISSLGLRINLSRWVLILFTLNMSLVLISKAEYIYTQLLHQPNQRVAQADNIDTKDSNKLNVYYVIADGLTSLTKLNQEYGLKTLPLETLLHESGYTVYKNSKSSYNATYLTLTSIFSLDYPVTENSARYRDRQIFMPVMLLTPDQLPLITQLTSLGYNFFYTGNDWFECPKSSQSIKCLEERPQNAIDIVSTQFFFNYTVKTFFKETIFESIFHKKKATENKNDAINEFLQRYKINKTNSRGASFYFIHNLIPHPPATDSSCRISNDINYKTWTRSGYIDSASCAILRITQLVDFLNTSDPNAIVVIQGDHGPDINYNFSINASKLNISQLEERFSIFNAVKLPKKCYPNLSASPGNVETINLVLSCIKGVKSNEVIPKHYAGYYDENVADFGTVTKIHF